MQPSLLLGGALLALPFLPPTAGGPQVGEEAPELTATNWFNSFGQPPSLDAYRGQAVLLEFWATW